MAQTAEGMLPDELVRLAEQLGFDSLWFLDHTHIPVASTAFPEA
jgi:alkanesulfonate monooxygenase SsuD/methylene tetrahydromethanopterin reductase-like flavin-dependent oxidoreductase (luciferase family)